MRKGLIKISDPVYNGLWSDIWIIFKDFRPLHIEFRHWENDTWYLIGECTMFENIEDGDSIPEYTATFTRKEDGLHTYNFTKV